MKIIMEDILTKLRCTEDQEELVSLLKKATKMVQDSESNAKSLWLHTVTSEGEFDEKDFITYIANSFVTILLYYPDELLIFREASDALKILIKSFSFLRQILGQSGIYHNIARVLEQLTASSDYKHATKSDRVTGVELCCLQLLLEMTNEYSENIIKCAEIDIMQIIAYILQTKSSSFDLYAVAIELLCCLIGKSDLNNLANHTGLLFRHVEYFQCVWKQQCLVKELSLPVGGKFSTYKLESSMLSTILQLMNSFLIDSDKIQLNGLKCLSHIIDVDGAYEILWSEGAFDTTLHACYHYITCKEIQLWGCLLLKLLVFRSL